MLSLNCYVGLLRPFLRLPFPLVLANRSITDYFSIGSQDGQGNPGIDLFVDETTRLNSSTIPSDRPTTAFYLQSALSRLTGNSPANPNIKNIGLIIADRYASRPTALGLMFDWGFNPAGEPPLDRFFNAVPREGCAIFLNAIKDIRPIIGSFEREVVFTAIHELGHVFNLWHINDIKNFMSTSNSEDVYPPTAYNFRPEQRACLHRADVDLNFRPGGSIFREQGFNAPAEENPFERSPGRTPLKLEIQIKQKEFWYFEPVELDIKLALTGNRAKPLFVPDEIDPGYDSFSIYITRPNGTRFKYRSPRIYCQNPAVIEIGKNKPFQRDVSIFGQSGSYTFTAPGIYSIQCFFRLNENTLIACNSIEVNVKTPLFENTRFTKLQTLLTSTDAALFLYHRSGFFSETLVDDLEEAGALDKQAPLSVNISYAIARFLTHKKTKLSPKQRNKASQHVNRCLDSAGLSLNREKNLVELKQNDLL